jgi:HprK-related kinase A
MTTLSSPGGAGFKSHDLYLRTGPFTTHLRTPFTQLLDDVAELYEPSQIIPAAEFSDFHVEVTAPLLRRWLRPKVRFLMDGDEPFLPLPIDQVLPVFEWGLNWCISTYADQYIILHAAVIAKGRRAVIMPGVPGAGKSTLTAGLVHRGWRLLSDELALISPATGLVSGLARPVSLKNESIEVIRSFAPEAVISRVAEETAKGTVAMMKAPAESVARISEPAEPTWIIFPKYVNGLPPTLERRPKAPILYGLLKNAFNHGLHGRGGFERLADIVEACSCYRFTYALLDEAVEVFDHLARGG